MFNFSITEYISQEMNSDELRAEVKNVLKRVQMKAIKELREDDTRMILSADKGVPVVVMDKKDYIKKAEDLLNQPTYKLIPVDPTTRKKNKLINLLKNIMVEGVINEETPQRGRIL